MDTPDSIPGTAADERLQLARDFPAADRDQWRSLVTAVLTKSGVAIADEATPEAALDSGTYDGFDLAPLYTAADAANHGVGDLDALGVPGQAPFIRGSREAGGLGWDVRQQHRNPDPVAGNRAVLADLENGASSLWLSLGDQGVAIDELPRLLDGVYLDLVSIVLDAGAHTAPAAEKFFALVAERGIDPAEVSGNLGADPVGHAARTGTAPDLSGLSSLAESAGPFENLLPITVDATIYHDAGGSDSDELAVSLAVGVAYLRALTDAGLDAKTALDQLEFRYAVTQNQFASIAKLRAARRLWDRIGEVCGVPDRRGQRQHAVTSAAMMTRRDPWVNLLRTTIACFAAAVGGAHAITVAPFDSAIGLPDDFGRRIARNTQSVLHDESSLARVSDPAGGSWYVESLTADLAVSAWEKFTEIERAGGAVTALNSGAIAELLDESWQSRRTSLAHRRDPITGVSEFANLAEPDLIRQPTAAVDAKGLPIHRYAEQFEAFRDFSDRRLAETGRRPRVVLAALGPVPVHAGRLSFARNLLEVGGVEPVVATEDYATAFTASGADIACLCSSDRLYGEQAATVAAELKAAGAKQVWIAGKPALATGDVDRAIYAGCDAIEALTALTALSDEPESEGVTA